MELDHLVVTAGSLEEGVAFVQDVLGVPLAAGGNHDFMATHNALLSLGPKAYLEVIAIDPNAPPPDRRRWFNLDEFYGPPRLTNWICRSDDITQDRARAPGHLGPITHASRGDLNWTITIPEDGKLPCEGLCPGLIRWDGDAHPAKTLPDQGVRLEKLDLYHENADGMANFLSKLSEKDMPGLHVSTQKLMVAAFETPHGKAVL